MGKNKKVALVSPFVTLYLSYGLTGDRDTTTYPLAEILAAKHCTKHQEKQSQKK